MARVDQPFPIKAISPLRLLAIFVFLLSVTGGLVYLFAMPVRQLYWGGERSPEAAGPLKLAQP